MIFTNSNVKINDKFLKNLLNVVEKSISALPFHFNSETFIEGIFAGDLFSLNSVLGTTIEVQAVAALNNLRNIWDPDNCLSNYAFMRSSHTFPDVRLVDTSHENSTPIIGIELKGWYLLTKEKVPTFRYRANPDACSPYDLLVVIPWYLKNILSGTPVITTPFITNAKEAAIKRNKYWQETRSSKKNKNIISPENITPYPKAGDIYLDIAESDGGGNFGRLSRVRDIMDDFIDLTLKTQLSGIQSGYWIEFFSIFVDHHANENISEQVLIKLKHLFSQRINNLSSNITSNEITEIVDSLIDTLNKLLQLVKSN